jgi:hypothetical protein
VSRGPVCALGESRRLQLWIGAPPGATITVDGRRPVRPPVAALGGLRLDVEAPPGARETVVEARRGGERWTARLAVEERRQPQWFEDAWALGVGGNLPEALRRVEPKLASRSPAERGLALKVAWRVHLAGGEPAQAEEELRRAIAAHRLSGSLSNEIDSATVLVFRLIQRRDFTAARALLEALPDPERHADSAYLKSYYEGVLGTQVGDLRTGLRQLRAAVDHAARAGLAAYQVAAGQVLARELQRVGRTGESRALFAELERAVGDTLSACDRAQLRNNQAWAALLAREAGTPVGDQRPLLAEVQRLFEEECTAFGDREEERINVRLNLALASLQSGDVGAAQRWLAEARRLRPRPPPSLLLWSADLDARVLLAAGRARSALATYQDLAARARELQSPETVWRAAYGEALAREALDDVPGALAAYGAAEELLERESLLVPMHEGRDTFVGQREGATRRYLDLLLRSGRSEAALAVARRARSRALRALRLAARLASLAPPERAAWERAIAAHGLAREDLDRAAAESWQLPGTEARRAVEESARRLRALRATIDTLLARLEARRNEAGAALAPPARGEVLLAYHPLPAGWVGFASDERGVVARRIGRLEDALKRPEALAARLLIPFAAGIRSARTVRVLPYGVLRAVDFHALPFDGAALLAAKPVVYALDLPAPPPAARSRAARALVVGDPAGDLPGARTEARRVSTALAAGPPAGTVELLLDSAATGAAVRGGLSRSAVFHYAGHAVAAGWDSSLPLAAGGRLTVDDVLALRRPPAWVVLSGCATGATPEDSAVESMGLAHAFLSAGAESVIAAVRPLPDREAAALVAAFYAELPRAGSPGEALRRAQLARRGKDRSTAWASFRAFVP